MMPLSPDKTPVEQIDSGLRLVDALQDALVTFQNRPAVVDADGVTTFGELNEMARRVSAGLDAVQPAVTPVVGIQLSPCASSIAVLLGIIFSGRAYLPLDPQATEPERVRITGESQAALVLNNNDIKKLVTSHESNDVKAVDPDHLAAVLYTSATTGAAKGVKLSHQCILFHALTYKHHMKIESGDRVSLFPSHHVGASISNLFASLLAGAAIYPLSFSRLGAEGVITFLMNHKLTVVHLVPSVFRRLAQAPDASAAFSSVHHLKLGGEPVTSREVHLFAALNIPGAHLMNGLGITEAGGNVTFGEITRELSSESLVPIGVVVDGISIENVPMDEAGEMVVRSRYFSSGYIGESTESPFSVHEDGFVTLRTSDMVKRNRDGTWTHLGRIDEVVKINGHRVALAEVTAALRDVPGVEDAAAVVIPDFENQSVLCGVLSGIKPPSVSMLREHMNARTSPAMIPARFYYAANLPRGAGGKVNRSALSEMISRAVPLRDNPPQIPSNTLEAHLLAIWKHVLRADTIGVADSFFSVGGDSLKAADLMTALHRKLQIHVNIDQLYHHDTIAKLAVVISGGSWREAEFSAVVLRPGNCEQSVFVIPGAGSDVVALWDLAHALPENLHVIGLQYPGLDGKSPYLKSVTEIAAHFIDHIKKIQPAGPCRVIGTSFGGMVAFEMTRQWENQGESVSFLGLIDTYAPRYLTFKSGLSLSAKIKAFKYWSLPIGQKHRWTFKQAMTGFREKCILLKARVGLNKPGSYKHRFYYLMEVCFNAGERYVIQPVTTPVTIFRVEQQLPPELFEQNEMLGWGNASMSGVKSVPIPGVHGAHIRPPHVFQLAAIIAREMELG